MEFTVGSDRYGHTHDHNSRLSVFGPVGWWSDILHHLTLIFTSFTGGPGDPLARLFLLSSPSPHRHHHDAATDYSSTLPCSYGRRTLRAGPILRLFQSLLIPDLFSIALGRPASTADIAACEITSRYHT